MGRVPSKPPQGGGSIPALRTAGPSLCRIAGRRSGAASASTATLSFLSHSPLTGGLRGGGSPVPGSFPSSEIVSHDES